MKKLFTIILAASFGQIIAGNRLSPAHFPDINTTENPEQKNTEAESAYYQALQNIFSSSPSHVDTNQVDATGTKVGFWIERMGSYDWEGEYVFGKKEGSWIGYPIGMPMPSYVENYHDGKKNGVTMGIDRAGYIYKIENYSNDSLDGIKRTYFTGGKLKSEEIYKNGKLHGLRRIYNNNTKIQEEGNYVNGVREGLTKWYYSDGKLNTESIYKNGLLEGKMITYHTNGNKSSEVLYKNNLMEGAFYEYYPNGKVKTQGNYIHSAEEGKWTTFYESGKVYETGTMTAGKREGGWKQSSEDGKTSGVVKYNAGTVVSGTPMPMKPIEQPKAPESTDKTKTNTPAPQPGGTMPK